MENKRPPNRQSSMDSNDLLRRQFRPEDSYPIVSQESFTPQVDGIQEICRYVRQEPQRTQPFACGYEFVQQRRFSAHEEYDHRPGTRQCVYPTAHYTDRSNDRTNGDGRYMNNGIQHIRFDEGPSPNRSIHQQNYELEISRRLIPHDFTKHPHRHEHSNDTSPIIPRVQDNHQLPHFERSIEQEQSPPNKHQTSESRINTGSSQQLRSPVAKRLPDAPVILQGWLHKQGSDGLHLWRRRWFVLSEFCLFYYKSQEELKLLGSILLPSYRVSACLPDDKVYRKFAFKLEHANMRTFILAAESDRAMAKWIDSLNLACKLQTVHNFSVADNSIPHVHRNGTLETETHRVLTTENQSTSEELTVVDRKISNVKTGNTSPVTVASQPSWTTEEIPQPLYANAPPKPRRLVDGHQMSPSPDMLDRKTSEDCYSYYRRSIIEREPNQYDHQKIIRQPNYRVPQNIVPTAQHMIIERRTPDTYGRSKSISSVSRMKPPSSDYEDVYNNVNELYKPPLSPIVYGHVKKASPVPTIVVPQDRPYIPLNMEPRRHAMMQPHPHYHYPHVVMRQRPDVPQYVQIARPHSADFLDYEMKHQNVTNDRDIAIQHRQPERPKSSLDITRRSNTDNYFYSEENYAEKMRQSALYLQRDVTKHVPVKKFFTMKSDYGTPVDDVRRDFESVSSSRSSARIPPENYDIHGSDLRYEDKLRSESVLSEGSLIKDTEQEINRNDAVGHSVSSMPRSYRTVDSETYRMTSLNQDIRREESMKRLLEWKQRMLQSPLNRKLASKRIGDPSIAQHSNVSRRRKPQTNYEHRSDRHLALQNNSYSSDDEASGSVSISGHDVIRSNTSHSWSENSRRETVASPMHISNPHLAFIRHPDISDSRSSSPQVNYSVSSQRGDLSVVSNEERMMYPSSCRISNDEIASSGLKLSAGELLGRTHEELVLLLIQLRRQSVNLYQAIEACYSEIYMLQNSVENDAALRLENLHRLDQLKQHLLDLEKQYEKGKPLVNLVDNMVKLGSLYRQSNQPDRILEARSRNRIEFNQHVQERRLLAEERRDWDHINPDHSQLQSKVQQLYELDGILRRESDTLAGLRQDKESLEQALYGLRMKLGGMRVPSTPPAELEWARRHQQLLEQELSRVHLLLAYNSKKLEETVAGNARLEQELIVLRQKLQMSRQQKNNNFYSNTIPKQRDRIGTGNGAMLEAELRRVQRLVGDLQRQRQELSTQVRHLIDKSHTLVQQIHRPAPTPLAVSQSIEQGTNNKKRTQTSWLETDLDSGITREHGFINTSITRCDSGNSSSGSLPNSLSDRPFTDDPIAYHRHRRSPQRLNEDSTSTIISSESDIQHPNTISHEKQEIKTVRIVKRESERRQRDRERTSCIGIPITSTCNNNFSSDGSTLSYGTGNRWGPLDEEDHDNEHSAGHKSISSLKNFDENNLETNSFGLPKNSNEFDTTVVHDSSVIPSFSADAKISTSQSTLSEISPSNSIFITYDEDSKAASSDKSPVPSPIFKSAAAQQIIIEMSGNISDRAFVTQNSSRRTIPKEKRRHYTAPHNNILIEDSSRSGPGSDTFNRMNIDMGRARDDLDMERALRPRINTPDVVRSTLSHKELKYNEGTIDSVLGTPNKIIIPERYIPEQTPQLSAEEQKQRLQKVESIKKMLSDSTPLTATSLTDISNKGKSTHSGMKQTSISEEKRQREHLLQLNQILAKQVMEMSKIVAGTTSNQRL